MVAPGTSEVIDFVRYEVDTENFNPNVGDQQQSSIDPLNLRITVTDSMLGMVGTIDTSGDSLGTVFLPTPDQPQTQTSLQTRLRSVTPMTPQLIRVPGDPDGVFTFVRQIDNFLYTIRLDTRGNANDYSGPLQEDARPQSGLTVTVQDLSAVPEPSSLALVGVGVITAVIGLRRRMTRKS